MSWLCPRCDATFVDRSTSCTTCGVPLVDDMRGRVLAGRYRLESVVGTGAQDSAVWKAWQMSFERPVAVKMMPAGEAIAAERFSRGAKIASMLAHPNITTVHDYGVTDDGKVFLVMELLEGHVLRSELRDGLPMPVDRALHIAMQVLRALEDAHAHSVVHRDLKPDNLFLTHRAGDPDFVKVLDFGIAKFFAAPPPDEPDGASTLDGQITRGWQLCGTPLYMAPEQISGEAVDGRTDIYALGVVLYQMLCGQVPFKAKTQYAVLSQHLRDPPPPFSEVRPQDEIPPVLEQVVRQALAKSRDERYATAREMRVALREVQQALGLKVESTEESDRGRPATLPSMQTMHGEPPPPTEQRRRWPVLLLVLLAMCIGALGMQLAMSGLREHRLSAEEGSAEGAGTLASDGIAASLGAGGGPAQGAAGAFEGAGGEPGSKGQGEPAETLDDSNVSDLGGADPGTDPEVGAGSQGDGAIVGDDDSLADPAPQDVIPVQVSLTSIPPGATARLGDEELGVTPVEVALQGGEVHLVTFTRSGYLPSTVRVDLTGAAAGATRAAAASLQPADVADPAAPDPQAPPTRSPRARPAAGGSQTPAGSSGSGRTEPAARPAKGTPTGRASAESTPASDGAASSNAGTAAAQPAASGKATATASDGAAKTSDDKSRIKLLGAGAPPSSSKTADPSKKPRIQVLDGGAPAAPKPGERGKVKVQVLGD